MLTREPGIAATGEFAVSSGCGFFPPTLLVECMAQLGGVAAGQRQGEGGVLAALRGGELPESVEPGTRFLVSCRVVRVFGQMVLIAGEVRQAGAVVASATLTLVLSGEGGSAPC